jgi:hypothetical protein
MRRIIFPVKAKESDIVKFSEDLQFSLKQDSSIAVEVLGEQSLYPVVQQASGNGKAEEAPLPYALTNPVFVDVDGNGKFDFPLPKEVAVKK